MAPDHSCRCHALALMYDTGRNNAEGPAKLHMKSCFVPIQVLAIEITCYWNLIFLNADLALNWFQYSRHLAFVVIIVNYKYNGSITY